MIKIANIVSDILYSNEIALESLRSGLLNLSAYSRQIKPEIEKKLYKKVRIGTIVTALSRLIPEVSKKSSLRPLVKIEDISIKSPLVEISFDKSAQLIKEVNHFRTSLNTDKSFFTVTQGFDEVTIIMSDKFRTKALSQISAKPKAEYSDLVAITIRIVAKDYIETPNIIYTLVSMLATQRINLIEIVSTFSEISFIVRQIDMQKTIDVFKNHF